MFQVMEKSGKCHFQSGKFRKNEKSQGISKKLLVNWLLVFHKLQAILEKECFLT